MAEIINFSIDLTKIDKTKIKEVTLKNGNVAKFIDLSMFIMDEQDQYGNIASVSINQTKEDREASTPKIYLGNGKRTWSKAGGSKTPEPSNTNNSNSGDDLPF